MNTKIQHRALYYAMAVLLFFSAPLPANEKISGQSVEPVNMEQAKTVSAVFDHAGRLWLAWVVGEHLYVNYSDDKGKSYSLPVKVNDEAQRIGSHGESRPQIAVARNGHVYVVYNQKLAKRFTGNVRFSRSIDHGKSFSKPEIIHDDRQLIGHSFAVLAVNHQGHVYMTWLDGRDAAESRKGSREYIGSSLYYSVSFDGGETFRSDVKLQDHSCQCCRIAMALDQHGLPVIAWRQIFNKTTRDHALIRFTGPVTFSPMLRASQDQWTIDSCPHHGPALSISETGRYHFTWFTGAAERAGIYYAHSDDGGQRFSSPLSLGDSRTQAQHPFVLSAHEQVFIVWKTFDGKSTSIQLIHSVDNGNHWSKPRTVAHSDKDSDHPFLIADGEHVYLSWHTEASGYRLITLDEGESE